MIVVFLIVLIMALIIGNILVSAAMPKKLHEQGFVNPVYENTLEPEVIEKMDALHENHAIIQGSLTAVNKKLDLLNNRLNTVEKVVMTLTQQKLNETKQEEDN